MVSQNNQMFAVTFLLVIKMTYPLVKENFLLHLT